MGLFLLVVLVVLEASVHVQGDSITEMNAASNHSTSELLETIYDRFNATIDEAIKRIQVTVDATADELRYDVSQQVSEAVNKTRELVNDALETVNATLDRHGDKLMAMFGGVLNETRLTRDGTVFTFDLDQLLDRHFRNQGNQNYHASTYQNKIVGGVPITAAIYVTTYYSVYKVIFQYGCTGLLDSLIRWPLRQYIGVTLLAYDGSALNWWVDNSNTMSTCKDPYTNSDMTTHEITLYKLRNTTAVVEGKISYKLNILL